MKAKKATRTKRPSWHEVFEAIDKAPLPDNFLSEADRDRSLAIAREAGRRLLALGGTMPKIKDVPRRKVNQDRPKD